MIEYPLDIHRTLPTRTGGGIGVNCYRESRIRLTIWKPFDYNRVTWESVSLTANQAARLANALLAPPVWQRIRVQDGTRPWRLIWRVFAVRHGNGFHPGTVSVSLQARTGSTISVGISSGCNKDQERSRTTDCWCPSWSVTMTVKQVKPLSGLLYLWAGSRMVGARRQAETTTGLVVQTTSGEK